MDNYRFATDQGKQLEVFPMEKVNHPQHYGGDTVYEAIKVIDAWKLNFNLGNAVKYISRVGKKGDTIENLEKSIWYLKHEIETIQEEEEALLDLANRSKNELPPEWQLLG